MSGIFLLKKLMLDTSYRFLQFFIIFPKTTNSATTQTICHAPVVCTQLGMALGECPPNVPFALTFKASISMCKKTPGRALNALLLFASAFGFIQNNVLRMAVPNPIRLFNMVHSI
jgi:hypothetical protein